LSLKSLKVDFTDFQANNVTKSTSYFDLSTNACGQNQPLDHFAVFQVRFDDVLNVVVVDKAVPHALGVNHRDGAASAAIQAAAAVDADAAFAHQTGLFDQFFAVVKAFAGVVLGAAVLAIFALIDAKKDVARVVRFGFGGGGGNDGGVFRGGLAHNSDFTP
jgi:hypothetical protein